MDKKGEETKEPLIHEANSAPSSRSQRSASAHESSNGRKSHRSRSPCSSRKRKSHKSWSPVDALHHVKQPSRSNSHCESSSKHSRTLSNSPERKTGKSSKPKSSEENQHEHTMWSPSGKWQVQTVETSGTGKQQQETKATLHSSGTSADQQLHKNIKKGVRIFPLEDKTKQLVVLEHPAWLAFKGITKIRCISGQVNIYGYDIKSSSTIYDVYSPASHSFLCIKTTDGHHGDLLESPEFSALLESSETLKAEVQCMKLYSNPVVILFERLKKPALDFIDSLKVFYSLFPSSGKLKGKDDVFELENVGIQLYGQHSRVTQLLSTERFSEIKRWITSRVSEGSSPVIVVCGGKSVGKSTLTRYLVNILLNRVNEVAYLECDVGQAEFTPGSCISVNRVTQPLLGPPFSHQEKPLCCCFLGVLSPSHNPEAYMNCVTYVYNKFLACSMQCPLVVNTMGWNKSIGLALLTDILRLVKPDLVIQIDSRSSYKNLPVITSDFIAENTGWISECISPEDIKQHSLIRVESVVDKLEGPIDHYKPVDHRSLSLLGYFDHLLTSRKDGLNAVIPYEVPWHRVAVHVTHASVPASQIMYALNASVVALCQVDDNMMLNTNIEGYPKFLKDTPVCPCLGFGVIRGIDPVKKVFYLVTPLSAKETSQVNCLLLGALEIPQPLLLKQTSSEVPYVGYSKDVIGAKCVSKRKHTKRRNRPFRWRAENKL